MHLVVAFGVFLVGFFLVPASIRSPRLFLFVWSLCACGVAFVYARHIVQEPHTDALAHLFDRAVIDVFAVACILSLAAFLIRTLAHRLNWAFYAHWVVLVLGCAALPVVLYARFVQ